MSSNSSRKGGAESVDERETTARVTKLVDERLLDIQLSLDELRARLDVLRPHCGNDPALETTAAKLHLASSDLIGYLSR